MDGSPAPPEWQCLQTQKAGSKPEECEDAGKVWDQADLRYDSAGRPVRSFYAAVSDGASESLLARAWAGQLVDNVLDSMCITEEWWRKPDDFTGDLLDRCAFRWSAFLAQYQEDRVAQGRPITWYEQPGLEKGAFATVLGVEIRGTFISEKETNWSWHSFALGDSCLFHLRDGAVHSSFPLQDVEEFGITPQLLGSRNHDKALVAQRIAIAHGELRPGDEILLTTDALAAWMLAHEDISPTRGTQLAVIAADGAEQFAEWIDHQRHRGYMRNDDVTLVRMRVRAEA
ncbi:hypothetical protein [Streptomyces murinus]|uniref:hypothetical protein n=1 Tax=Streptomyces murinus TaxID=33900 RepID=UPI002E80B391|nr:hypothetical protein [Streptomyces murinus]WUD07757.1 hypothetical protein OG586_16720 [Streptomyces murinus]